MAFKIIRDDITKVVADAIVDTANCNVAVGDGVDRAIYEAAGKDKLLKARAGIGVLKVGEVGITPAFALRAKHIIHSSGPVWQDGSHGETVLLRQCYDRALRLAAKHRCKSIAFPLMATGTYGFPKELGMQIAIDAFRDYLQENEMEITLVVSGSYEYKISGNLYENVQSYVDDRYVEKTNMSEYKNDGVPYFKSRAREKFYDALAGKCSKSALPCRSVDENAVEDVSMAIQPQLPLEEQLKKACKDSFEKHLQQLINKKGMKNSEVYAAANISKQYFSKLMKGKVKPSKEKVLSLAVGLQLNMDETIDFLRIAGYAFSPVSQTDIVVEFFINKKDYNVMKIDIVLFDYGLPLLSE